MIATETIKFQKKNPKTYNSQYIEFTKLHPNMTKKSMLYNGHLGKRERFSWNWSNHGQTLYPLSYFYTG